MSKTSSEFVGWYTSLEGGTEITTMGQLEANNRTLYAQWERYRTINFLAGQGGTGTMSQMENIKIGDEVTLTANAFTHSELYFIGWIEQTTNATYGDKDKVIVNNNMVLIAQWAKGIPIESESIIKAVKITNLKTIKYII